MCTVDYSNPALSLQMIYMIIKIVMFDKTKSRFTGILMDWNIPATVRKKKNMVY